jgi:hypothetical protein
VPPEAAGRAELSISIDGEDAQAFSVPVGRTWSFR